MARRIIRSYSRDEELVKERREHIHQCAVKVFLKKGYNGTSTRELAKACGMSEGALYHYIGAKADILHLICTGVQRYDKDIQVYLDSLGDVSVTQALRECIKLYFKWSDEVAERNLFFNREMNNFSREDRRILMESQANFVYFFERLIKRGIEAGEFKTDSPLLLAHDIVVVGFEWGLRQWFLKQYFALEEYTEKHINSILKLIATAD